MAAKKSELSQTKVELATVKEIVTMTKRARSWEAEVNGQVMKIRDLVDEINRAVDEARSDYSQAEALAADLERAIVSANAAAEELGINADSIKELSDGLEAIGDLDYGLTELDEMITAYKSI